MNDLNPYWSTLVLVLWMLPILAVASRPLGDALIGVWRASGLEATLFVVAVIWMMSWAFPSSADKGGGETNNPTSSVSAPEGKIRIYYTDSDGHLVPFSGIKEEK